MLPFLRDTVQERRAGEGGCIAHIHDRVSPHPPADARMEVLWNSDTTLGTLGYSPRDGADHALDGIQVPHGTRSPKLP